MQIICHKISSDLQLTICDYETAVENVKKNDSTVWIDAQGCEKDILEKKLDDLDITGMTKKLCLDTLGKQGFYPMNRDTFLIVPVLAAEGDYHGVEHVAFLIKQNFLLTLRDKKATQLQKTISLQDSSEWLPEKSVQGLVTAFLIVLSLEALQRTEELRKVIMILERQMDSQPDSVSMEEISHKRSELLTFESVVSGQLPVLEAFVAADKEKLKIGKIQEYLICAQANLQATNNALDWLEGRIDVLRAIYDTRAQERTNRRLGRLTIVSAIFLPMSFLAGIWGMNFKNMPLLNQSWGLPVAISSMFLIALVIYIRFKKNKWFD